MERTELAGNGEYLSGVQGLACASGPDSRQMQDEPRQHGGTR